MFTRHGHSLTDKLDCPHAIRTKTLPPQRAESFHHILLLPPASLVRYRRKLSTLRVSLGASAAQLQAVRLWLCRHAGACPPAAQRTATGYPGRCPLKSLKQGLARRLIGDAEHFWRKRYYDSTFEITRSLWRSCATFIVIRSNEGCVSAQKSGRGVVFGTTLLGRKDV
jgi:hypothetical protein